MSFFFLLLVISVNSQSLTDPRVYNCYFYGPTNADLSQTGLSTCAQLQTHWLTYGINEGRQACGAFHVLQFLDNYPQLKQQFGSNYTAAILYYLNTGYEQGLLGYTIGGAYGRYTVGDVNTGLYFSGSDRTAGAIDSVVWNNVEFINAYDHGRELQVASTTTYGECFNPTEAGSSDDFQSSTTSSILSKIDVTETTYTTTIFPAFWMQPGQCEPGCGCAVNQQITSNWTFNKQLTLGYNGLKNVLHFVHNVVVPLDLSNSYTQIEAPTGYMVGDIFNVFWEIDLTTGALKSIIIDNSVGGSYTTNNPVIISSKDSNYAMGALPNVQPMFYLLMNYATFGNATDHTTKWSIISRFYDVTMNSVIYFDVKICIGTLNEVQTCLITLHKKINSQSLTDPRVFNCYFYGTTNADLSQAGLTSCSQLQTHWLNNGINEGRQACGAFHVLQFLDNYPSLKQEFGTNYTAAILYYLNTGYEQGLLGYTIGGAYGRYTVGDVTTGLYFSGSDRTAGAIDSVVWNNVEFINAWDHGRELQVASTTTHGECYNPTEAGSSDDLQSSTTSSILSKINVTETTYTTSIFPAFWMQPGQCETGCGCAVNKQITSNWTFNKQLTIGYNGVQNVIHFVHNVVVPIDLSSSYTQIEAPTGYMVGDVFNAFWEIDLSNNGALKSVTINNTVGGNYATNNPVIIASQDSNYAMGALPTNKPQHFVLYNFDTLGPETDHTTKWSIVTHFNNVTINTVINFDVKICIGTLNDVQKCMVKLNN